MIKQQQQIIIFSIFVFLNVLHVFSQDTQDPFYDPKVFQAERIPEAPEFIVYENDMPCVLVKLNASLIIEPKRTANKKIQVRIPRSAEASGNCGIGDDSKIILKWSSFLFTLHFQKSRVSDAWYVDSIEAVYNTSDKAFDDGTGAIKGAVQVIRTDGQTLFLTPIGRSYSCSVSKEIKMFDLKKTSRVTLLITRVEIQPFGVMTQRQYGDPFFCSEQTGRRDETVPLAVGSMLAIVVLLTIAGYAGYRYFKVKKVEYDTME